MYSLEECERLWEETGQHGTPPERIQRAESWLPYYAWLAALNKTADYTLPADDDSFPSYLIRQGLVKPSDRVLDIGAGMGGDSLRFAAQCEHVTAVELSPDSLEVLRHRATLCSLANITPVLTAWENYHSEELFDVSYSAMCPAICNVDELRRMESVTKRLCCLVAVMRGSYDKHRKAMMTELGIQPKGGMTTELIYYYNALYLMGRQPNVLCRTQHYEYDVPVEKLMEQYPIYFKIFGVEEGRSQAFLCDYLARHAENGLLHEESRIHFAWLWWEPGK